MEALHRLSSIDDIAQLGERLIVAQEVISSNPICHPKMERWLSGR